MDIYQATNNFPREEAFWLTSQLRRAAVSVASNIVEGCVRITAAEYIQFLTIAYASAREAEYQISLAERLGFLEQSQFTLLQNPSVETCKVINGLIRSLRK